MGARSLDDAVGATFDVLLLIGALTSTAAMLVGAAGERLGIDREFRASSARKRVLSVFTVGNMLLQQLRRRIGFRAIQRVLRSRAALHRDAFPKLAWSTSNGRRVRLQHDLFCADCGWRGVECGWPP